MEPALKCINLDWLEVFCIEDGCLDANYFINLGWAVDVREYGTPLYKQMFTLLGDHGHPFLEIRREPYSLKENGGIFERGACHIRLSNRTLYTQNPIQQLQQFLVKYNYKLNGITRIDVACDQLVFDNGMDPGKLIDDYMKGSILKNRNSKINVHGCEKANGRAWNSIKWGSPSSPLSTKIYDKTLELKEGKDKFYIKDCWVKAGLCDLQKVAYDYKDKKTGEIERRSKMMVVKAGTKVEEEREIDQVEEVKIWRVEFSIKAEARNWISIDKQHKLSIGLTKFLSKERCMLMFIILSKWCLNFVQAEYNENGQQKRKDRCKPVELYTEKNIAHTFKPHRITEKEEPSRIEKIICNRLIRMSKGGAYLIPDDIKMKCLQIANFLSQSHGGYYMTDQMKKRTEELHKTAEENKQKMQMELDTFEGLNWIEKWKNNTLSMKERNYILKNKRKYVTIFVKRAEDNYKQTKLKLKHYKNEFEFWSGKTMPPDVKQILYDLPF